MNIIFSISHSNHSTWLADRDLASILRILFLSAYATPSRSPVTTIPSCRTPRMTSRPYTTPRPAAMNPCSQSHTRGYRHCSRRNRVCSARWRSWRRCTPVRTPRSVAGRRGIQAGSATSIAEKRARLGSARYSRLRLRLRRSDQRGSR